MFDSSPITLESHIQTLDLVLGKHESHIFSMRENLVQSEESRFDPAGFTETNYTFYRPQLVNRLDSVSDPDNFYEAVIYVDKLVDTHKRSIYTIWDLLGDIGGLLGIL